jgi:hypothetical protein
MSEQATDPIVTPAAAPQGAVSASGGTPAPADPGAPPTVSVEPSTTAPAVDPAVAPREPGKTLLEGGDTGDEGAAAPGKWPENWRDEMASGDAKLRARLDRFTDPRAILDFALNAEKKISSGQAKTELKADATDEEKAAWRAENGIPEKAEGYEPKVEGLVLGEADKAMLDTFQKHAHAKNWSPDQFNQALEWYAAEQNAAQDRQYEADHAFKAEAEGKLRQEWGPEFRPNINAIANLMSTLPGDLGERLVNGRTADGKRIGDDPAFAGWLASMSREMNPAASVLPSGTPSTPQNVDARIAEIKEIMVNDNRKYVNSPALQTEYMNLVTAREKLQRRAA